MFLFFCMSFLYISNKLFHYNEVAVTILTQRNLLALKQCIYVKQDQFIYFLPVPCEKDVFPIKASFNEYVPHLFMKK